MSKRILLLSVLLPFVVVGLAQSAPQKEATSKEKRAPAKTKAWKIQNAMSAAPHAIAKNATIVDHQGKEGGEMAVPPLLVEVVEPAVRTVEEKGQDALDIGFVRYFIVLNDVEFGPLYVAESQVRKDRKIRR